MFGFLVRFLVQTRIQCLLFPFLLHFILPIFCSKAKSVLGRVSIMLSGSVGVFLKPVFPFSFLFLRDLRHKDDSIISETPELAQRKLDAFQRSM